VTDGREEPGDTIDEFSLFLHGLRSRELERLPPGAKVVLSGGAAGAWYFDWFESHYPTAIERHIGVEALAPKPDGLPDHVEWIEASLGDLSAVGSQTVDLVFGGEVVEHLWPHDIAGFLSSAHRVLRSGGRIALDSPNRRVTQAIRWLHPEHTVEFTVDEIVELLGLAGFEDIDVRGVLLGYDADCHQYFPLHELSSELGREERVERASERPEDSLVWWAEATRGQRHPDDVALERRVLELFSRFRTHRFGQLLSSVGSVEELPHHGRVVHAVQGESGAMLFGPYVPMPRGTWEVTFELTSPDAARQPADEVVGWIDVVRGDPPVTLGRLDLKASDVDTDWEWSRQTVRFCLEEMMMGVEFRLFSEGRVELAARAVVDVRPTPPPLPAHRNPRHPIRNWLRRHPRTKALAKKLHSLLPN
jgi:SAM-dependent methyltransferase